MKFEPIPFEIVLCRVSFASGQSVVLSLNVSTDSYSKPYYHVYVVNKDGTFTQGTPRIADEAYQMFSQKVGEKIIEGNTVVSQTIPKTVDDLKIEKP
jgi:hypothetical protein